MPNQKDFIDLIKTHEGLIYKICDLYTNTTEDKLDLYQEIVFQTFKSFNTFKGNSKISTWIYRIALNTALTTLNKSKRKLKPTLLQPSFSDSIDRLEEEIYEERSSYLYREIKKLSPIEKSIILLYLEGQPYEEIAKITGFTKTNIGTRLNRIKVKLKQNIKNN